MLTYHNKKKSMYTFSIMTVTAINPTVLGEKDQTHKKTHNHYTKQREREREIFTFTKQNTTQNMYFMWLYK